MKSNTLEIKIAFKRKQNKNPTNKPTNHWKCNKNSARMSSDRTPNHWMAAAPPLTLAASQWVREHACTSRRINAARIILHLHLQA